MSKILIRIWSQITKSVSVFLAVNDSLIPYLLLLSAPLVVFWRFLPRIGHYNRAYLYQDTTLLRYPFLVFLVDSIRQYSEVPLWSWGIFSGIPFHSSYVNFLLYPLNLLFYIGLLAPASAGVYHLYMIIHFCIGGIAFYLLARCFNYKKSISVLGSLVYCFSGLTLFLAVVGSGWFIAHAWLPLAMYCLRKFVLEQKPVWILFGAIFYALIICCLSPYVIITFTYFLIIFFICSIFIEKRNDYLLFIKWGIIWLLLSWALMASYLFPLMEMSLVMVRQSITNFLYARDVYFERDVITVVKEFFWGGDHAFAYLGAVGGLLALIGILTRKGKYYLFWLSTFFITIIAFYAAKDFSLYDFFYLFLPKIKNINAMSRNVGSIYVISGAFLIMTAIGYGTKLLIITKNPSKISKAFFISIGALAIILWLVYKPDEINAVKEFSAKYVRWLFLWVLVAIIISTMRVNKYRKTGITIILTLFAIDMLSFVQNNFETTAAFSKDQLLSDKGNFLVDYESPYIMGRSSERKLPSINKHRINQFRNNTPLIQGKDNTGGYYPPHPRRATQAMWASGQRDQYVFKGPQPGIDLGITWPAQIVNKLYDLDPSGKGRAWVVLRNIQTSTPPLKELTQEKFAPYEEVYLENENDVIRKEFGNLYFKFYKIMSKILTPNEKNYSIKSDGPFSINDDLTLLNQTPNSAIFRLEKDVTLGALFFSDNWYPGWVAYVNGKRVPLYVANYTFKGILLNYPKSSVVEFVFNPPIAKVGNIISAMALLVLVFLCGKLIIRF